MAKIKTDDLPVEETLSEEELRETRGGFTSATGNVMDSLSSATSNMTAQVGSLAALAGPEQTMTSVSEAQQSADATTKPIYASLNKWASDSLKAHGFKVN